MSTKLTKICLYFQVHQPHRLRKFSYFDIGQKLDYFDEQKNRDVLLKVANKCYLPTNELLLKLLKRYQGAFKISFSISGVVLEQFIKYAPQVLESFKKLYATGCVEILNETYYHSLSGLFAQQEFRQQVQMHADAIYKYFGAKATTFRNTELIYNDDLAKIIADFGYKTVLAEGAEKVLDWRSPNYVYQSEGDKPLKLLLRNYKLSDDIAFRFSNRNWCEYPVNADKYSSWIHALYGNADVVNLFMDYETFGEHQWQDTGIFEFLKYLPEKILHHSGFGFATPEEIAQSVEPVATLSMPHAVSWADEERDVSAWCGNNLQTDALRAVYELQDKVLATGRRDLISKWRSLLISDHFYYMCIKYDNDGDVHKYFSPYNGPYEAYMNFQNILSDLCLEIERERRKNIKLKITPLETGQED